MSATPANLTLFGRVANSWVHFDRLWEDDNGIEIFYERSIATSQVSPLFPSFRMDQVQDYILAPDKKKFRSDTLFCESIFDGNITPNMKELESIIFYKDRYGEILSPKSVKIMNPVRICPTSGMVVKSNGDSQSKSRHWVFSRHEYAASRRRHGAFFRPDPGAYTKFPDPRKFMDKQPKIKRSEILKKIAKRVRRILRVKPLSRGESAFFSAMLGATQFSKLCKQ